jgi:hypothetical protein
MILTCLVLALLALACSVGVGGVKLAENTPVVQVIGLTSAPATSAASTAATLLPTPTPAPVERLAFFDIQNNELAVIQPDGTRLGSVVEAGQARFNLLPSPDHRLLAMLLGRKLLVVQADGLSPVKAVQIIALPEAPPAPGVPVLEAQYQYELAWSPDSQRLAAADLQAGVLYVVDLATAGVTQWASGLAISSVTWTPDGGQIIFAGQDGLYRSAGEGQPPTLLAAGPLTGSPAWSPESSRLLFWRAEAGYTTVNLFILAMDGSGERALTSSQGERNLHTTIPITRFGDSPWSPDGQRIAYQYVDAQQNVSLMVMNADGSGQVAVASGLLAGSIFSFGWSPDGTRLALLYPVSGGERMNLAVAFADGSGVQVLAEDGARAIALPAWSPDGSRLAYLTAESRVSIRAVDGGGELASHACNCVNFVWLP